MTALLVNHLCKTPDRCIALPDAHRADCVKVILIQMGYQNCLSGVEQEGDSQWVVKLKEPIPDRVRVVILAFVERHQAALEKLRDGECRIQAS